MKTKENKAQPKDNATNALVDQIVHEKDITKLNVLGKDVYDATVNLGEKYLALCLHIRTRQIPPRVVSEQLAELGFHKVRISEVNRVSQCADQLWNEFEAKAIGFKKVLAIARGGEVAPEDVTAAPGQGFSSDEQAGEEGEEKSEKSEGVTSDQQKADDEKQTDIVQLAKAAKTILLRAAKLNMRTKKWTLHNGYELKLIKLPAAKKNRIETKA